jgi:hypothetical protein
MLRALITEKPASDRTGTTPQHPRQHSTPYSLTAPLRWAPKKTPNDTRRLRPLAHPHHTLNHPVPWQLHHRLTQASA